MLIYNKMFFAGSFLVVVLAGLLVIQRVPHLHRCFLEIIFFTTFGLVFGFAPLMQARDCYASEFGEQARVEAAWFAAAGICFLAAGFSLAGRGGECFEVRRSRLLNSLKGDCAQSFLTKLFWLSVFGAIVSQLLMMYARGVSIADLLASGRFTFRFYNTGVLTVLATHLGSFVYAPAFIGPFLSRRYQRITLIYVIVASGLFFFVFAKGTRSIPLSLVMTTLVACSLRYAFSWKQVLTVSAGGVGLLLLAVGLAELRKYQNQLSFEEGLSVLFSADSYKQMWEGDPLGYSANLVGAVATFPDRYPYLDGATYRRMPVFFLPESSFPEIKPPDSNIIFGLVVHQRDEELRVTCPPSILGDVWINFWGWMSLPVLIIHGWIYRKIFYKLQTSLWGFMWLGPLSGRFLVLVQRGEPYEMFVLFVMFFAEMLAAVLFVSLVGGTSLLAAVKKDSALAGHRVS